MRYVLFLCFLIFSGCSIKSYEHTQAKIIIIKSPKLKFADIGYVRNSDEKIEVELFVAGRATQKITINHLICTTDGCMSKNSFNAEYLSPFYPGETLQNIILGRKIFGGKNFLETRNGFSQYIKNTHVDITYKVGFGVIYFKDKKNKIILKFKDTN